MPARDGDKWFYSCFWVISHKWFATEFMYTHRHNIILLVGQYENLFSHRKRKIAFNYHQQHQIQFRLQFDTMQCATNIHKTSAAVEIIQKCNERKMAWNLCPKNGVINCIHTQNFNSRCWIFLNKKFFMLQQWNCGEKFMNSFICHCCCCHYQCICVWKRTIFFHKIIFRKEWKIFYRSGPLLRLDHTHSELDASSTLRFATHSRGRRSDLTTVWSSLCLALPLLLSYLLFYTYIQWTTGKREAISWHVEV